MNSELFKIAHNENVKYLNEILSAINTLNEMAAVTKTLETLGEKIERLIDETGELPKDNDVNVSNKELSVRAVNNTEITEAILEVKQALADLTPLKEINVKNLKDIKIPDEVRVKKIDEVIKKLDELAQKETPIIVKGAGDIKWPATAKEAIPVVLVDRDRKSYYNAVTGNELTIPTAVNLKAVDIDSGQPVRLSAVESIDNPGVYGLIVLNPDGSNLSTGGGTTPAVENLLLENGDNLLLENGDYLLFG